jgi:hypothetical protein
MDVKKFISIKELFAVTFHGRNRKKTFIFLQGCTAFDWIILRNVWDTEYSHGTASR